MTTPIDYVPPKLIKHKDPTIRDGSNFILMVGQSGTGKTMLLLDKIPGFNMVRILIFSLIAGNPVHFRIYNWAKEKGIEAGLFNDIARAKRAIQAVEREHTELETEEEKLMHHTVIIMDDFSRFSSRRGEELNNFAIYCFSILRNHNCSMIHITQDWTNIPTLVRTNGRRVFVFPFRNQYGLGSLRRDITQGLNDETIDRTIEELSKNNPQSTARYEKYRKSQKDIKTKTSLFWDLLMEELSKRAKTYAYADIQYPDSVQIVDSLRE